MKLGDIGKHMTLLDIKFIMREMNRLCALAKINSAGKSRHYKRLHDECKKIKIRQQKQLLKNIRTKHK